VVDVTCFQWRSHLGVHEFCPELNLMVTGPTREDVVDRMRAALQQHCGQEGVALGNISDEIIARHMINS
jgi:hypothetical protein